MRFPNNSKNTNHMHILLTGADRCGSELSKHVYFEKKLFYFILIFQKIWEKIQVQRSYLERTARFL